MNYQEKNQDLFEADFNIWTPVHCISSDCKMGAGIAVPMRKKFNLDEMRNLDPYFLKHPNCVYYNGVLNLITKAKYWHKPTMQSMKTSLEIMRDRILILSITHIVMPKIGAGLDRLAWNDVRNLLFDIFQDNPIEILVCIK